MKTKLIVPIVCLLLMATSPLKSLEPKFVHEIQSMKIVGVYDGNEGYGYNFITTHSDGSESTTTFQKVDKSVMNEFDLDADLFINQKFEVTYTVKKVVTKDENGFDDEDEINTITHLKAL